MRVRYTTASLLLAIIVAHTNAAQPDADVNRAIAGARVRASAGDVVAQFSLGSIIYYGGDDTAEAVEWFRRAAAKQYAPAEFQLGQLYDFGFGVEQDDRAALDWYQRAATHGSAAAQRTVGEFYRKGRVVTPDAAEAARWFRRAADADDIRAQYQLGQLYFDGTGVPRDYVSAYLWFSLAASQAPLADNRDALLELRNIAAARMSAAQLAGATKRVAAWRPRTRQLGR